MRTPRSRHEQRMAHSRGEAYRGCGTWPLFGLDSPLEPLFEPYSWSGITEWDLAVNGFTAPYQGRFMDRLKRLFVPVRTTRLNYHARAWQRQGPLHCVRFRHYHKDEVTPATVEQLLLALEAAREPITLEVFGTGKKNCPDSDRALIETRFVVSRLDLPLLKAQLHSLYPRSAVESHQVGFHNADHAFANCIRGGQNGSDPLFVSPCRLQEPYCFPIRLVDKTGPDPMTALIAVMDRLGTDEWALLQVIFCRARHHWAENLRIACEDPYKE